MLELQLGDQSRADAIRTTLGTPVTDLLGTRDPDLFRRRLVGLRVDLEADEERDRLEGTIDDRLGGRVSGWEMAARLALVLTAGCLVLGGLLLVSSWALDAVGVTPAPLHRRARRGWLGWPPTAGTRNRLVLLLLLAALSGAVAAFCRYRDALRTARLGLMEAARLDPDTWPGIPVESPFAARAHVWGHCGASALLGATALAAWHYLGMGLGAAVVFLAVLLLFVGAAALFVGHAILRVDELARRTLFVGRV